MPVTRLGPGGYGVRRAGDFSGKTAAPSYGPHPVGVLSRFGLAGYGVRRAGDFSGKTAAPIVAPALDFAPGGFYPELHRHSRKVRKEIERAEQLIEDAPKVVAKAIERAKVSPETLLHEPLIATITDALTRAHEISREIASDFAAIQRKMETQRAIRAAKALLDEIEALERDDEEAIALLLSH